MVDWLKTAAWIFRGQRCVLIGLLGLVALVYAYVPLTVPGQSSSEQASQASAR